MNGYLTDEEKTVLEYTMLGGDAYDLLTGPWRDAIGPIHPDDAPMAGSS